MNLKRIQLLREGKVWIRKNSNETVDDLNNILRAAFHGCKPANGLSRYYFAMQNCTNMWSCCELHIGDVDVRSVAWFSTEEEWTPKWGEDVLIYGQGGYKFVAMSPWLDNLAILINTFNHVPTQSDIKNVFPVKKIVEVTKAELLDVFRKAKNIDGEIKIKDEYESLHQEEI